MATIAPVAFPLLLGSKWDSAVMPFMLFCAILPLRMAHSLSGTVMLALGRAGLSFASVLLWAIVLSPMFFIGAKFGLVGVATSWAIGFPVVYGLTIWMTSHMLNVSAVVMFLPMVGPALAAAVCAGAVTALRLAVEFRIASGLVLLLLVFWGVVSYIASLRVFAPAAFEEMLDLLSRAIGRRSGSRAE